MTTQKPGLQIVPALTEEQDKKVADLLQAVSPILQVSIALRPQRYFCRTHAMPDFSLVDQLSLCRSRSSD
jgi:hypothetical protein